MTTIVELIFFLNNNFGIFYAGYPGRCGED